MEKIFAFAGSFNPPHVGHMMDIQDMLDKGADRIHLFVRINEGVDLVDKATKLGWFERMKQEYKGWDKVIIHEAVSSNVKGKKYSLDTLKHGIDQLHQQAGEHITHFYAGSDYAKYKLLWKLMAKDVKLVIVDRADAISSTNIRNDLERYKFLVVPFVYEDLKAAAENKKNG